MDYKDLEKDIREKLPELMEVSRGCEWVYSFDDGNPWGHVGKQFEIQTVSESCDSCVSFLSENQWETLNRDLDFIREKCHVIGHDIQLHHVLKYLSISNPNPNGYMNSYIGIDGQFYKDLSYEPPLDTNVFWNLDKPNLKDQSKELKDYLISLL